MALTFGQNNANTTFNGLISGTGSLIKVGYGVTSLPVASTINSYTGGTTINGGTLYLYNCVTPAAGTLTPLGTGVITLGATGTNSGMLVIQTAGGNGNAYTYNNKLVMSGGTLWNTDGLPTFTGNMTISAGTNSTIMSVYNNKFPTFSGALVRFGTLTLQENNALDTTYGAFTDVIFTDVNSGSTFTGTLVIDTVTKIGRPARSTTPTSSPAPWSTPARRPEPPIMPSSSPRR